MKSEHDQLRLGVGTTLDEPVKVTIMRDAKQVAEKLKVVLLPLGHDQDSVLEKLRECAYTELILTYYCLPILACFSDC